MYLSKIWLFLLGVAAAVALALAIIVPRPAARTIAEVEKDRLERAQVTAQYILRVHARKWIDAAVNASLDGKLRETLDRANGASEHDLDTLHAQVVQHLNRFHEDLEKVDEFQIALDASGRVIGRTGVDANDWKDGMSGHPLVADALRGYARDDIWVIAGHLYVVGATPVPSAARAGTIAGAYVVGDELSDDVASKLKTNLGAEIAFFANKTYVSASTDRTLVEDLTKQIDAQKDSFAANGRSKVLPLSTQRGEFLAILAPLPGVAGEQDSYYAVLAPRPQARGLMGTLKEIDSSDKKSIPWVALIGLFVLAIGVGMLVQILEHDRPIKRLFDDVQKLSRGDIQKLDDMRHKGKYGSIARSVNMSLERIERDVQKAGRKSGPNLGDLLGPPPGGGVDRSGISLPAQPGIPGALHAPRSSGGIPSLPPAAPAPAPRSSGGIPSLPPAPASRPPGGTDLADLLGLPPQQAQAPARPAAPPPRPPEGLPPIPSKRPPAPPVAVDDALDDAKTPMASLDLPGVDQSGPVSAGGDVEGDVQTYHRQIYDDFVSLKKKCGESIDGLTFDKFALKLKANRDQLVDKYGAKSVKFQVYVKDGKAALKATPVK